MFRLPLLALPLLASAIQPIFAQPAALPPRPAATTHTDTATVAQQGESGNLLGQPRLFARRDAYIAGGFALAALALFPLDRHFAEELQSPAVQANRGLENVASGFEKIASPGAYYIGGGLYLLGRLGGSPRLADLGLHGTEAVVLAEGVGFVLKRAIGRARPYLSNTTKPGDFSFATGFGTGDRRSLPSGHTATAFAVASAVTSEAREWWPHGTWIVAPVMYGGAAMVGLSRMYHNQHWASDIALGAAVGTFSGLALVRYMHGRPGNRLDRMLLGAPLLERDQNGTRLGWRFEW